MSIQALHRLTVAIEGQEERDVTAAVLQIARRVQETAGVTAILESELLFRDPE